MSATLRARTQLGVAPLEDRSVPAAHAAYTVTQDWGSGFEASVRLSNDGQAAVPFAALQFSLPSTVSNIWDARVVSHVGDS